jgi:hypothetical protein
MGGIDDGHHPCREIAAQEGHGGKQYFFCSCFDHVNESFGMISGPRSQPPCGAWGKPCFELKERSSQRLVMTAVLSSRQWAP